MGVLIFERVGMGTRISITVHPEGGSEELESRAQAALDIFGELERIFSLFTENSEISRVNRNAGGGPIEVSRPFAGALGYALRMAASSRGRFDPAVGVLTWPGSNDEPGLPKRSFRDIVFDKERRTVQMPAGTALDLNAVVKGWAIDLAMERFGGAEPVLVEAGGDIKVRGLPQGRTCWKIGVRDPAEPGRIKTLLPVVSGAACTTGGYFRGGDGRPHLVGPDRGIASVTVVAPSARDADALGTAAYFMGPDEAIEFIEGHGAAAFVIGRDGLVFAGDGMREIFAH